jgi:hypothetical protein
VHCVAGATGAARIPVAASARQISIQQSCLCLMLIVTMLDPKGNASVQSATLLLFVWMTSRHNHINGAKPNSRPAVQTSWVPH